MLTRNLNLKKLRKFIYPSVLAILLAFIILILKEIILFSGSVLNEVFQDNTTILENQLIKIDKENYRVVSNKLGIQNPEQSLILPKVIEVNETVSSTAELINAPSTSEVVTTSSSTPLNQKPKETFTIAILNSTKTKGLAGELKENLEKNSFAVIKIGNISSVNKGTVLRVKTGSEDYAEELLEIISNKYPVVKESDIDQEFDYIIIIGE